MLLSLTLIIAPVTAQHVRPILCVEGPLQIGEAGDQSGEVIIAVRARLARRAVRVVRCSPRREPTWKARAQRTPTGEMALSVRGSDLDTRQTIATLERDEKEIIRVLALTIVEAVRPAADALFVEMGYRASKGELDEALASLEDQARPDLDRVAPEPDDSNEVRVVERAVAAPHWQIGLGAAPRMALQPASVSGFFEIHGGIAVGPVMLVTQIALNLMPTRQTTGPRIGGQQLEASLGAELQWRLVSVGAGAVVQRTELTFDGGAVQLKRKREVVWSGGLALHIGVWPVKLGNWHLGGVANVCVWHAPRRVTLLGKPVLTQSYVDVGVGPSLRFVY